MTVGQVLENRKIARAVNLEPGLLLVLDGGELFKLDGSGKWSYTTQPSAQQVVDALREGS